ncbi:MAG: amidohydrolase family protein [Aestuariivita sp.]|nr:amidohydrolase family protein [Aestuariivita sp.]MCY4204012.1 amidohydrolase family protein [Aestuariivita sp.]
MIDTHQHFWRLSRGGYAWMSKDVPVLFRDYEPDDLKDVLAKVGVKGTIAVQADDNVAETEFLLSLAAATPWIMGVVGWVDLGGPAASHEIARLAENPKLVGIRPMIQDITDQDWMLGSDLAAGLEALKDLNLTFDALILQKHLPNLDQFLDLYPNLRVVIDHCAKPSFEDGAFSQWAEGIGRAAAHANCFCKLSGLMTEAPQGTKEAEIRKYLHHAVACFGADRVLFGSDWPVLNVASDYVAWVKIVRSCLTHLPVADQERVFSENPLKIYPRIAAKPDADGGFNGT